jgi:translation initiation factor 1
MAKKPRIATDDGSSLEHPALAGLGALRALVPDGDDAPSPTVDDGAEAPSEDPTEDPSWSGKIVVRREKKGRGGKAATVIEGIREPQAGLQALARRLRKSLGCGVHVEGLTLVLQGVQTDRVAAWLREQGATRVIVGN